MESEKIDKKELGKIANLGRKIGRHAAVSNEEGAELYALAKHSCGHILECGSFRGRSAAFLALGNRANSSRHKVICVDPMNFKINRTVSDDLLDKWGNGEFNSPEEFNAFVFWHNLSLAGLSKKDVDLKIDYSTNIDTPQNLGLVFFDSNKQYDTLTRDFHKFWPSLKSGGYMAWHDVKYVERAGEEKFPDMRRFWAEFIFEKISLEKRMFKKLYVVDKMLVVQKF